MRKIHLIAICLILSFILIGCGSTTSSHNNKDSEIAKLIAVGDLEQAKQKVYDYYKDDKTKLEAWLISIDRAENKDYKQKLVIQEGWTWERDGNYTYIRGRVKNTGNKTIRYFEVTAQYLDKNKNVLDTNYTNSGEKIRPGDSKEFEIMHRHNSEYEYVSIFVEEVSIE